MSDYYQCWKQLCWHNILVETMIYYIFQGSLINRKFKRTFVTLDLKTYVFTVTFDQSNASFMIVSIIFLNKLGIVTCPTWTSQSTENKPTLIKTFHAVFYFLIWILT